MKYVILSARLSPSIFLSHSQSIFPFRYIFFRLNIEFTYLDQCSFAQACKHKNDPTDGNETHSLSLNSEPAKDKSVDQNINNTNNNKKQRSLPFSVFVDSFLLLCWFLTFPFLCQIEMYACRIVNLKMKDKKVKYCTHIVWDVILFQSISFMFFFLIFAFE